jgi:transcriptional regulator with XRE-family HTH domain
MIHSLLPEQLGKRIKMIRIAAGIKQKDLAEKLSIPAPLLSMYEKGSREPPLFFLASFSNHFNMTLSQLFMSVGESTTSAKPDIISLMSEMKHLIFDLEKQALQAR